MEIHANNYMDEDLGIKLEDSEAKRLELTEKNAVLEQQVHESRQEIERLRKLVLLLGGNPDRSDSSIVE